MIFNSLQFIPFIIIVLVVHRFAKWKSDKYFLLFASYCFYASFDPPFVLVLLFTTVVDYLIGRKLAETSGALQRRFLLFLSLACNLGLLCYFKYAEFLADNLSLTLANIGVLWEYQGLDIVLPIGISFYTFQSLSYTIDIYRKKLKPYGFIEFALFVSFFTQLVAGPIVRAAHLLPQLSRKKTPSFKTVSMGVFLVVLGYFKKLVIADNVAEYVDLIFANPALTDVVNQFAAVLAFSVQIFCDFSGYSDIAIGLSLIMGIRLKRNFNMPYLASGFAGFWRCWHISLSSWIRDYLYIPLGGNRRGLLGNTLVVMFTMTLFGLWHGASWMFVIWGALHGAYILSERVAKHAWKLLAPKLHIPVGIIRTNLICNILSVALTFWLTCFAWIFFRAGSVLDAWVIAKGFMKFPISMLKSMLLGRDVFGVVHWNNAWSYILVVAAVHVVIFLNRRYYPNRRIPWPYYSCVIAIMLYFILTSWESSSVFIYFQF